MSEIDRAELRRLLDEATPGPWEVGSDGTSVREQDGLTNIHAVPAEDAALVVAATSALPGLLDELAKLEARLAYIGAAHKACHEQRDAAWAAIERVRELHRPTGVDVLQSDCAAEECEHEFECPPIEMAVCRGCYILGESIDVYSYERGGVEHVLYPCPTIQALDGGGPDE